MSSQAPTFRQKIFRIAFTCACLAMTTGPTTADEPEKPERPTIAAEERQRQIPDIDGNLIAPLAPTAGHYSILIFTATECPIANAFSPEVSRIAAEFAAKNFSVFLVYTDPELDSDAIRTHLSEYSLRPVTAILDVGQVLVRATGATHTPEASIIDSEGKQLYRGRINNRYAALGKARHVITQHDLRSAIDAIVLGTPVTPPRTEVIGCYIPTPRPGQK